MLSFEYKYIHAYLFWETLWEWMNILLDIVFQKHLRLKELWQYESKEAIL